MCKLNSLTCFIGIFVYGNTTSFLHLDATVVNVQASVVNATAISLSWNVSLSHGLNVSHFNIHYKAVVNDSDQVIDEFTTKRSKSSTNAVVLIRDFTPQLQHQFQVSMAIAIEGKGLYVAKKSAMTMRSTVTYGKHMGKCAIHSILISIV